VPTPRWCGLVLVSVFSIQFSKAFLICDSQKLVNWRKIIKFDANVMAFSIGLFSANVLPYSFELTFDKK